MIEAIEFFLCYIDHTRVHTHTINCLGTGVWEEHFPILNWILVLTMEVMVSTNHIIVVPSLYQFITTSVSQDGQNTTEVSVNAYI